MAWTKVGTLKPGFAGSSTSTAGGSFTLAFPAGRFAKPPIVTVSAIGAYAYPTAVTAASITGTVLSLPALLGLSGVTVDVVAQPAG